MKQTKPRLKHMVACKMVGEYTRNQEKVKRFGLEEKAQKARQQAEQAIQARSQPLQEASTSSAQNPVNRQPRARRDCCPCWPQSKSPKEATPHKTTDSHPRSKIPQGTLNNYNC